MRAAYAIAGAGPSSGSSSSSPISSRSGPRARTIIGPARIEVTMAMTTRATKTSSSMIPAWRPVAARMMPVAPRALSPHAIAHASRPMGNPAALTPTRTDSSLDTRAKVTTVNTRTGSKASMKSVFNAIDTKNSGAKKPMETWTRDLWPVAPSPPATPLKATPARKAPRKACTPMASLAADTAITVSATTAT
jgi:hypothetical protein